MMALLQILRCLDALGYTVAKWYVPLGVPPPQQYLVSAYCSVFFVAGSLARHGEYVAASDSVYHWRSQPPFEVPNRPPYMVVFLSPLEVLYCCFSFLTVG